MPRVPGAFLIVLILLTGCDMNVAMLRPSVPLENDGELFLYLEALPQDAQRLKFTLGGVSALKADGTEYPLSLSLTELSTGVAKRQRLLGSVRLPPGAYTGLSMKVSKATLRREGEEEEGKEETDLLLP